MRLLAFAFTIVFVFTGPQLMTRFKIELPIGARNMHHFVSIF